MHTQTYLIKNRAELEKFHGKQASLVLSALEAAIRAVDPASLVKRSLSFKNDTLIVKDIRGKNFKMTGFRNVYVIGAGKASASMATALSWILEKRIAGGAIIVPEGKNCRIDRIHVTYASHPIPNKKGVAGAKKILSVMKNAQQDDLVIMVVSGGASALMPLPAKGVALADKQRTTSALLASGATIHEMNAVRKHLSAVKGGQLMRQARSRVLSLILSDVIDDDMTVIASGPTFPDSTTFADALRIMKKYDMTGTKAARFILRGVRGLEKETPKPGDPVFDRVVNVLIGNNRFACQGAIEYLHRKKLHVQYLGSNFDGQARDFGRFIAKAGKDMRSKTPFALIAGGETIVKLGKRHGVGGRNQEAALAFALCKSKAVAAFIGTDGIDGNSDAAGALVSEKSIGLAKNSNARMSLLQHDSYHALKKMNSLIFTGYTGTNVNDIAIAYLQAQ